LLKPFAENMYMAHDKDKITFNKTCD